MSNTIFLDCETLPSPNKPDIEEIKSKAPGNLKKEATIQRWAEENQDAEWRKQALNSMEGQLLAIGYAVDDGPVECLIQGWDQIEAEFHLLDAFQKTLCEVLPNPLIVDWIGHNVRAFDLPWIWRKALKYRLFSLAGMIPRGRYNKRVIDTMEEWAADFKDRVSLDNLAHFLGLQGKPDGIDGSKVYDFFQAGRLEEIREYCRADVALTRDVYKILNGEDVGVF